MLTAGLAPVLERLAPAARTMLRDDGCREWAQIIVQARRQLNVSRPCTSLSDEALHALGLAAHEIAHGAVAIAVGDVVESAIVQGDGSGTLSYWPVAGDTAGTILARLAVCDAGEIGYFHATGDPVGAVLGGRGDREAAAEILAATGLPEASCRSAQALANRIALRVLEDPDVQRAVTDLAIRLTDVGAIDGEELHRRLVIPDHVLAYVRPLVA